MPPRGIVELENRSRSTVYIDTVEHDDEGSAHHYRVYSDGTRLPLFRRGSRDDGYTYVPIWEANPDVTVPLGYAGGDANHYFFSDMLDGDVSTVANLRETYRDAPSPNRQQGLDQFLGSRGIPFETYLRSEWTPWEVRGDRAVYRRAKQTKTAIYDADNGGLLFTVGPIALGAIAGQAFTQFQATLAGASVESGSIFAGDVFVSEAGFLGDVAAETIVAESSIDLVAEYGANALAPETVANAPVLDVPVLDVSVDKIVETVKALPQLPSEDKPVLNDYFTETIFDSDIGYPDTSDFQSYADDMVNTAPSDPTYYAASVDVFPDQIETIESGSPTPAYIEDAVADEQVQSKAASPTDPYDVMQGSEDLIRDAADNPYTPDGIPTADKPLDDLPFNREAAQSAVRTVVKAATTTRPGSVQTSSKTTRPAQGVSDPTKRAGAQTPKLADFFGRLREYADQAKTVSNNVRAIQTEAQRVEDKMKQATTRAENRLKAKRGTVAAGNREKDKVALAAAAIGAFVLFGG